MSTRYLSPSNEGLFLWRDRQRELFEALLTAQLYDGFYRQPGEQLAAIRKLIRDNDAQFVAKLAVYLREELHVRTLSFVLTAELAAVCKDKALIGRLTGRVIQQANEIPAWLDYYEVVRDKGRGVKLSSELRKSVGGHFNRLDTYRYVRLTKAQQVRLRHALSVVRPKAAGKPQQALFRRILQDKLPARNAWQSEYEALQGHPYDSVELKQSALREKWKEGISAFRMGYKALLEHLPDVLEAGVSGKVLKLAAEYLGNAAAVAGSRLSPQEFLEAYWKLRRMEKGGTALLQEALEKAMQHGTENLAGLDELGRVVIAMDISPSMRNPIREDSLVQRYDVALFLAMLLKGKGGQVSAGIIGNVWKQIKLPPAVLLDELTRLRKREGEAGYAINAHLVIQDLLRKREAVDHVMIFTDVTLWNHREPHQPADADIARLWRQYRQIAPQAKLYLFDLAGYGKKPLECLEDGVYLMAGWNDRVFGVLEALEGDAHSIEAIERIIV
ncbi:MAG TPA: TROVE domain-containing protein [Puia sp.]|jgi:hypothetical protein